PVQEDVVLDLARALGRDPLGRLDQLADAGRAVAARPGAVERGGVIVRRDPVVGGVVVAAAGPLDPGQVVVGEVALPAVGLFGRVAVAAHDPAAERHPTGALVADRAAGLGEGPVPD